MEEVLRNLPVTIQGRYENTMKRIRDISDSKKQCDRATLAWLEYAQLPISIRELRHALAIDACPPTSSNIATHLYQESEIIFDYYGLLINNFDCAVRFVHKSAQDFLHASEPTNFPTSKSESQFPLPCTSVCRPLSS